MRKRHRRLTGVLSSITVVTLVAGYVGYALIRPLPLIQPVMQLPKPVNSNVPAAIAWPAYGGQAVGTSGMGVLAHGGQDTPLATASIAKVITALCVLQKKPLKAGEQGPTITITQADVDSYNSFISRDGSVVPVTVGEQLSEYQALQALLLPSANNIAETLARWAFGSVADYLTYANTYVHGLGLNSITITDPSGLDGGTVGSPSDLTALGETALQDPVITEVVSQPTAVIPVAGTVRNVNHLLGQNGLIGIKTGNNDQDPGAFLFAAKQTIGDTPVTIVGTDMGAPDLESALKDSLALVAATRDNLHEVTVITPATIVGSYSIPWQGKVTIMTKQKLSSLAWADAQFSLSNATQPLGLKPQSVGSLYLSNAQGKIVASTDLKLQTSVQQPGAWWRLTHPR